MTQNWVLPRGSASRDDWDIVVDEGIDGWRHTGLMAGTLGPQERRRIATGARELVVVPLDGSVVVHATDGAGATATAQLAGRPAVFAGPTDVAYIPRDRELVLDADRPCRVALAVAALPAQPTGTAPPFRPVTAAEVPVELRGAGRASREVRNFGVPDVLDAEALIACEVLTPAGNWSSFPPHKHDERRPGLESELEEIYYCEVQAEGQGAPADADPLGYLRVYGAADWQIDVLAEVRTDDVVLVPHGWHGPAMALPGSRRATATGTRRPGDWPARCCRSTRPSTPAASERTSSRCPGAASSSRRGYVDYKQSQRFLLKPAERVNE